MRRFRFLGFAFLAVAAALSARAAPSIPLAWDAVLASDLAGYRVFVGTVPGVYTSSVDAPASASFVLASGLADCTNYYLAVKARDAAGNLSPAFSNEVSGWPAVTATVPAVVWEQGRDVTLAVTGTNFRTGAVVSLTGAGVPAIAASSVTVASCLALTATFRIPADAPAGARSVRIQNPDGTFLAAPGVTVAADALPAPVLNLRRVDK